MTKEEKELEVKREYFRKYYQAHKEKIIAYGKQYRQDHREESKKYQRQWRRENPELCSKFRKRWRLRHPERYKLKCKKAYQKRQEIYLDHYKKYRDANPEKVIAQRLANKAIKKGVIKRPTICSFCEKEGRVDGHHEDYSKPLEIKWLCRSCHKLLHKMKEEI